MTFPTGAGNAAPVVGSRSGNNHHMSPMIRYRDNRSRLGLFLIILIAMIRGEVCAEVAALIISQAIKIDKLLLIPVDTRIEDANRCVTLGVFPSIRQAKYITAPLVLIRQ